VRFFPTIAQHMIFAFVLLAGYVFAGEIPLIAQAMKPFVFISGGSGAIISEDGFIITNNHVVAQGETFGVALSDGRTFSAEVVGRDRQGDLALLRINGAKGLTPYKLGDSDKLQIGQSCYALGNPLSLGADDRRPSVSKGVISALHQFRRSYTDAIVVDAAINPGNSGGPLINDAGELIGINGMTQTRMGMKSNTGVGYAIGINQIKLWLPYLRNAAGGNVFHGRLTGLELEDKITDSGGAQQAGVSVKSVAPNSPAAHAGFKAGDTVISFMDYHIPTVARFNSIQGLYPAGNSLHAEVENVGQKRRLNFPLPALRPWKQAFTLARPESGDKYPKIGAVINNSAADIAGLKAGDFITEIGSMPVSISAIARVGQYFANLSAGDTITLTVQRGISFLDIFFTAE